MEAIVPPKGWGLHGATYGQKLCIMVDNIVCSEQTLDVAGFAIGYTSSYRAREAATKMLRHGGQALSGLWGIG